MKDKKVFFKENIVIALIWNLFYVAPISIMVDVLTDDLISAIGIVIFLYGILVFNSIKSCMLKSIGVFKKKLMIY